MKKYILLILLAISGLAATAQTRKYVGSFSLIRPYYNPSLTAQQGSQLTTLYRNQWTGFEDAPKTIFATAEFGLGDFNKKKGYQLSNQQELQVPMQHALGLLLLRESFGPYTETQVNLNYGSGVNLSEKLLLRWGGAVTYTSIVLDGTKLTVDQENDPKYTRVLGQNSRSGKMDLNLGLTLASDNFYLGYAVQDVTQGKLATTGDDLVKDMYARKHIGQAGIRAGLTNDIGLVLNGLYQYDKQAEGTIEGQLKAVYQSMLWAGAGYRHNQAFTATAGLRFNKFQVSYLYETPVAEAATINKPSNEITLAYQLTGNSHAAAKSKVAVW